MSDRPLNLLLIDPDPIFRLGLRIALEQEPNLQVISEAQTDIIALQILAELALKDPNQVNLVILELGNGRSDESQQLGLQLCRQIKALYPNLPLLLVTSCQDEGLLLGAKALGVDGYCPKGTPLNQIVSAIEIIASGQNYWFGSTNNEECLENIEKQQEKQVETESASSTQNLTFPEQIEVTEEFGNTQDKIKALSNRLIKLRSYLYSSGSSYINKSLTEVRTQLQVPGIPILDRAILTGRQRELFAARWLLQHLV
ncbi:MAG: response regulator transcription factor, partial [Mastigocoleus sp. MO_167.B18]|nr:response regulator transcription factor [Mastigocoleus sp. MO_167.B18]